MKKLALGSLTALMLSSCMGTMGLTGKVRKFNLEATEHRWGREGIFLGFTIFWVYRVCAFLDLIVFNSIEFWSGENPINGASPLVDVDKSKLDAKGFGDVETAQIERLDSETAKLYMEFEDGNRVTFDVKRTDDQYTVSYLGKEYFTGKINQ